MLNAHVLESPLDGSTIRPDKRLWKQFLRLLVIIDEFSRECLAIYVARRITSDDVLRVLQVGGYYLLYAWGPRKLLGRAVGLAPHETESLLAGDFERCWIRAGEEQGSSSYWYLFKRR